MQDLTNQIFGKLKALEPVDKFTGQIKQGSIFWKCLCECGNFHIVYGYALRNGTTKSCGCVSKAMREITRAQNKAALFPENLTEIEKAVFVGSMLGDGNLHMHNDCGRARYRVKRNTKDIKYLEWNFQLFEIYQGKKEITSKKRFDKRTDKFYETSYFQTRTAPVFGKEYYKWYDVDKIKIVPNELELNLASLTIWIADDGSFYKSKTSKWLSISTDGFDIEYCEFLRDKLNKFIPGFNVYKHENNHVLRIINNSIDFMNLITPGLIECHMERKLKWHPDYQNILKEIENNGRPNIIFK